MVLLFFSTGEAEEQCCCTITCSYETVFGGTKRKTVDQCFDIGIGSGKVANCKEDDACLSAIELGWLYLNEWEGSGCSLRDSDCLTAYLLGDGSPELDILRQFRDEVLSKTAAGREIIRLYYYAGPMLIQAMEKDEKLRDYMTKLLDTALLLLADGEMK
jgi:hypothetical protein